MPFSDWLALPQMLPSHWLMPQNLEMGQGLNFDGEMEEDLVRLVVDLKNLNRDLTRMMSQMERL